MKSEDFLNALGEAEDRYVTEAGRKAGLLYLGQRIEQDPQGTVRMLQPETARQRSVKRIWTGAAACAAAAAVICGGWLLVRQGSLRPGSIAAASNGTQTASLTAPITETTLTPANSAVTEAPRETTPPPTEGEDRNYFYNASADPGELVANYLNNEYADPCLGVTIWVEYVEEPEQKRQLLRELSESASLQNGQYEELAALLDQTPDDVTVVRGFAHLEYDDGGHGDPEQRRVEQLFFLTREDNGPWTILDRSEPKDVAIPVAATGSLPESAALQFDAIDITYAPEKEPKDVIQDAYDAMLNASAASDLSLGAGGVAGGYLGGTDKEVAITIAKVRSLTLQNGQTERIVSMLEADSKDIAIYDVDASFGNAEHNHVTASQYIFLIRNQDGCWEILDVSDPL